MEENCLIGPEIIGDNTIDTSRVGKILIAHPHLPNSDLFAKSVVYIYSDDTFSGAKGLIVNKPSVLTISDICSRRGITFLDKQTCVFQGGPVAGDAVTMLHTAEWQSRNTTTAGPDYLLSSDYTMFEKIAQGNEPIYWRCFAGIASWAPGQLDMEIEGDFPYQKNYSWLIADANDDILFEYQGREQWEHAIELASKQMVDNLL